MLLKPTPLQKAFQDNPRLCPHDYRFSLKELETVCSEFTSADPFHQTSRFFIDLFEKLRNRLSTLDIFDYSPEVLRRRCIDLTNSDAAAAYKQQTSGIGNDRANGPRHFLSVLGKRSVSTASGAYLNLDESFPALADTLQTLLDALPYLARRGTKDSIAEVNRNEFETKLVEFGILSNGYRIIKEDWERALWLNFRLNADEHTLDQTSDPLLLLALRANLFRYQTFDFELHARSNPKDPPPRETDLVTLYQAHLHNALRQPTIKTLLRLFGNLKIQNIITLNDLFRTLLYLRAAAEKFIGLDADVEEIITLVHLETSKLTSDMSKNLALSEAQLSAILEILNYHNLRASNIWTSPVQHLGNETILVLPALVYSNLVRFLELTIIQRGMGFDRIGKDFENAVRRDAKAILSKHAYKKAARMLPIRQLELTGRREEIDLAIEIGPTLFIVEIKYDHFPTESYEIYNFIRDAGRACNQAQRKVEFFEQNLPELRRRGLVDSRVTSVSGMVLNNTMLLSGTHLGSIPIIDLNILENYLENVGGDIFIVNQSVILGNFRKNPYYSSQEEFERAAQGYFFDPPQPKRYEAMVSKVRFSRRGGPIDAGYDLAIHDIPTATDNLR
jgi:hypothetical protein